MKEKIYTENLQAQIIKECKETKRIGVIARRYGISSNTINDWIRGNSAKNRKSVKEKMLKKQLQNVTIEKENYENRMQDLVAKLYKETYRTQVLLKGIEKILDSDTLNQKNKEELEDLVNMAK